MITHLSSALVFLSTLTVSIGAGYHVSADDPNASDAPGGGTPGQPWKSLSYAAGRAQAGDTVIVHSGNYNERLILTRSGTGNAYITFRAAPGPRPVIDGTGRAVDGRSGLVDIRDLSFIRIEGFKICNYRTAAEEQVPVGILVEGTGRGIEIVDNHIENIASEATPTPDPADPTSCDLLGRNAHGIAIYGNDAGDPAVDGDESPITDLLIRGNELTNLTLGSSEALVINGNVRHFRVLENHIHHCDNIGIDLIGFEYLINEDQPPVHQARDGWVAGNHVHHITTRANPSYTSKPTAGGIYIDGGRDLIVERNHVHECDFGIEIASEHAGTETSRILVRSNLVHDNFLAGISIGGFDDATTGDAVDCAIIHNTLSDNDTDPAGDEYGQIYIQYRVNHCVIANNILYSSTPKGTAPDLYNMFIIQFNDTGSGNTINHNLHFGPNMPVSVLRDEWREGWTEYTSHPDTGPDEKWGDPAFVDPAMLDYDPSPPADPSLPSAIDTANSSLPDPADDPGRRDFRGNRRIHGGGPDRGAFERHAPPLGLPSFRLSFDGIHVDLQGNVENGLFHELQESADLINWWSLPGYDSLLADDRPLTFQRRAPLGTATFFRAITR